MTAQSALMAAPHGPIAKSWAFEQFAPPENELLMFAHHYDDERAQAARGVAVIDPHLIPAGGLEKIAGNQSAAGL